MAKAKVEEVVVEEVVNETQEVVVEVTENRRDNPKDRGMVWSPIMGKYVFPTVEAPAEEAPVEETPAE